MTPIGLWNIDSQISIVTGNSHCTELVLKPQAAMSVCHTTVTLPHFQERDRLVSHGRVVRVGDC
jgi:hypothetical protein